jgi:hypothetical protein
MNCAEAKRYLALIREGELSAEEERNLDVHLRVCPVCAAERAAYIRQERAMAKLRSISPALRDPEAHLQAVLARVRAESRPRPLGRMSALVVRTIDLLEVPGLRYALAAMVTILVTGFIMQQILILRSVSALESRLAQPEAPRIRLSYALSAEGIEQLKRSADVRAIIEHHWTGRSMSIEQLRTARASTIADLIDSPESRWVLRSLIPAASVSKLDALVRNLSRNARLVLTYSKGEASQ